MSGSGKGVSGVVGISRNESGAGTFPDTFQLRASSVHLDLIGLHLFIWGRIHFTHLCSMLGIVTNRAQPLVT